MYNNNMYCRVARELRTYDINMHVHTVLKKVFSSRHHLPLAVGKAHLIGDSRKIRGDSEFSKKSETLLYGVKLQQIRYSYSCTNVSNTTVGEVRY